MIVIFACFPAETSTSGLKSKMTDTEGGTTTVMTGEAKVYKNKLKSARLLHQVYFRANLI